MNMHSRNTASDKSKWLPAKAAVVPPYWDRHIAYAIRAFREGKASADQQILAYDWLMYVTKATPEFADLSFRMGPDAERETAFSEGKRFVGMQILKMSSPLLDVAIEKETMAEAQAERRRKREEDLEQAPKPAKPRRSRRKTIKLQDDE